MDEQLPERPRFLPPGFGTVGHQDFVELSVPEEVALAPQTPAWYVLGAVLAAGLVLALVRTARRYRRDVYRRAALSELVRLREAAAGGAGGERSAALERLPELLKRCALAAFPRERVAALSGARTTTTRTRLPWRAPTGRSRAASMHRTTPSPRSRWTGGTPRASAAATPLRAATSSTATRSRSDRSPGR